MRNEVRKKGTKTTTQIAANRRVNKIKLTSLLAEKTRTLNMLNQNGRRQRVAAGAEGQEGGVEGVGRIMLS